MTRDQREREERYRFTRYHTPTKPFEKPEKQASESND